MTEFPYQENDMTTESNGSVVEEDDLFGDYDPSLNEDTVEEEDNQPVEDEESEETPQVAGPQDTFSLDITYNKEKRSLSKEEAIEYAQKGMNYDKVLEKYNSLKDNEGNLTELSRLAEKANMSTGDLIRYLNDQWAEKELNDEVEALKETYPSSDEKLLVELARNHISERRNLVSQKKETAEKEKKAEISRQMDVFARRYPDVDASKLEPRVYELMKDGYTLLEAYDSVQAEKRAEEDRIKASSEIVSKKNEENRKKSYGNTGNNGYSNDNDDFLKGLFSD